MLIFAHRGASKAAPENTVKAFKLAFEQRADGIEFDTYQHESDIIVFHDSLKAEKNLKYVLPKLLEEYTEKGWKFESLF